MAPLGKTQVCRPHVRPLRSFLEQMFSIEESTCDIGGSFRRPRIVPLFVTPLDVASCNPKESIGKLSVMSFKKLKEKPNGFDDQRSKMEN